MSCWSSISGTKSAEGQWECIKCQVCGKSVEGGSAEREAMRMREEAESNMPEARVGRESKYCKDAEFVLKLLPDMDRDQLDFNQNMSAMMGTKSKQNRLDRENFPPGTAGYLYAQARILLEGLEDLTREMSVVRMSDFNFEASSLNRAEASLKDGSVKMSWSVPSKNRKLSSRVLLARMGKALLAATTASFACEIGLKAILVTRRHEAEKEHDLLALYKALPLDSQRRLQADYPSIVDVLERCRHTFGRWRYFEQDIGQEAMSPLLDEVRVKQLVMAVRVIMDECVISGLQFKFDIEMSGQLERDSSSWTPTASLSLASGEAAIPWEAILAWKRD